MPRKALTEHERWTLLDALHTAAEQYHADAVSHRNTPRVAEQFLTKTIEAKMLATRIEQADEIELSLAPQEQQAATGKRVDSRIRALWGGLSVGRWGIND